MVVLWEHTHQYIPHRHGRTFVSLRGDSSSPARYSSAQVRSRKASRPVVANYRDRNASPWQPGCPQAHITSVEPLRPSQWALQNFSLLAGTQLHAGLAHFF